MRGCVVILMTVDTTVRSSLNRYVAVFKSNRVYLVLKSLFLSTTTRNAR